MKNLSFLNAYSYLGNFVLYAFVFLPVVQLSAQFDLIYENHNQEESRIIRAVADNGAGQTAVAGHFETTFTLGAFTLTNTTGNLDAFTGKFDSNTNSWLWAKKITLVSNGSGNQYWSNHSDIMDIVMDAGGNVYITGSYSGVVSFDNISLSSSKNGNQFNPDIFVAKYNSTGAIVWAKSFGSKAGLDRANTITLDGSNNIFICGIYTNKAITCNGSSADKYDIYLAKLNNAGTTQWEKRYASAVINCTTSDSGESVTTDANGNVMLGGLFTGTVSFGSGSGLSITSINGTVDPFVAKINSTGTTQWVKAVGTTTIDYGTSTCTDNAGNVYIGGKIGPDAFMSKYNSAGSLVWSVNPFPNSIAYPSATVYRILSIAGSLLIADSRIGFKTISPVDGSTISSDTLVGNIYPGPGAGIMDAAVAGSGYVFNVTGKCGTVTIGGTPLTSFNDCPYTGISRDIFIVRNNGGFVAFNSNNNIIDPLASPLEFAGKEMEVYPNPATDQLHIDLPKHEKEITLFIQNQFGHTVWSEKFESQRSNATISLHDQSFQNGIYYLTCLSNVDVKTTRFVIDK